jgi:formate-dependent nitrite reductase cytochrome c552 subunit
MNASRRPGRSARWSIRYGAAIAAGIFAAAIAGCSDSDGVADLETSAAEVFDCAHCHRSLEIAWSTSSHAVTQLDVAAELAEEGAGKTPDQIIHGEEAEDCIACHGPRAILAADTMTEAEALGYFFTTTNGTFGSSTVASHMDEWLHVGCLACHEIPDGQPSAMPTLAIFESRTAQYMPVSNSSDLCGQCHGSLRFTDTDHLTYDAWSASKHSLTQEDVAEELAEERAGETPRAVVFGDDPENCIGCHGPTAVLANGGMREDQALGYFFTSLGGVFGGGTTAQHTDEWPDVACTTCHDQHHPDRLSFFDSQVAGYRVMSTPAELCGQCHGSLRFPGTDHLSFDLLQGTGGVGVPDQQTMSGVSCVDCHMVQGEDETTASMQHGHSFKVIVAEEDGGETNSCSPCHAGMQGTVAQKVITSFQSSFAALDEIASANVEAAAAAMEGVTDPDLLALLEEAQHNLEYAGSDESGGFHNHRYLMALLTDANERALELLGG